MREFLIVRRHAVPYKRQARNINVMAPGSQRCLRDRILEFGYRPPQFTTIEQLAQNSSSDRGSRTSTRTADTAAPRSAATASKLATLRPPTRIALPVDLRSSFATAFPVLPEPPMTPKVAERFIDSWASA
jgi:hypothetical protein